MTRKMLLAVIAAVAISASVPAKAATYNVSFDGTFFDVFAQLTVDGLNNVTGITGTVVGVDGAPIGGVAPLGNPNWIYDNQFFASSPFVDNGGILFSAGLWLYNLYSDGPNYFLSTYNPDGSNYNPGDRGTLAVAQTPLPAAIWLFGTVIMGAMGFFARLRRRLRATLQPNAAFA